MSGLLGDAGAMPVCRARALAADPWRGSTTPRLLDHGYLFFYGDARSPAAHDVAARLPAVRWVLAPDDDWVSRLLAAWPGDVTARASWRFSDYEPKPRPPVAGATVAPLSLDLARRLDTEFGITAARNFDCLAALCAAGGAVVFAAGAPVAVSCAFAALGDEFEVAVATLPHARRRSYGQLAAWHFIESCRLRGGRVHWDATSAASLRLALRLGFRAPVRYTAYQRAPTLPETEALLAGLASGERSS